MSQFVKEEEKRVVETLGIKKVSSSPKARMKKKTSVTFWNALRVQNGVTLMDMEELIGVSHTSISNYLTGKVMPDRRISDKISHLFGVDPDKGWTEFGNAHEIYYNTHGKTIPVEPKGFTDMLMQDLNKFVTKEEVADPDPYSIDANDKNAIIEELLREAYELVTREEFTNLVLLLKVEPEIDSAEADKILDIAYRTVSMETFVKLVVMLKTKN